MIFIYPYKAGSASVKALRESLGAKTIKLKGSKFRPRANRTVINWGSSSMPEEYNYCRVLNSPEAVKICSNKKTFFEYLEDKDVRIPEFATHSDEVAVDNYDRKDGKTSWVARHKLQGHSGEGIELISGGHENIPDAPLYVRYIPKKEEYRVHVFNEQVVDVQRKARSKDVPDEDVNWQVRNHSNGFIFARNEDHTPPEDVVNQALNAVREVGLDFGAVDVLWNEKAQEAYVLEINTAPGLTGATLEGYTNRFSEYKYG